MLFLPCREHRARICVSGYVDIWNTRHTDLDGRACSSAARLPRFAEGSGSCNDRCSMRQAAIPGVRTRVLLDLCTLASVRCCEGCEGQVVDVGVLWALGAGVWSRDYSYHDATPTPKVRGVTLERGSQEEEEGGSVD